MAGRAYLQCNCKYAQEYVSRTQDKTTQPADPAGLLKFKEIFGKEDAPGRVICLGDEDSPLVQDVRAMPYLRFAESGSHRLLPSSRR